MEEKIKIAKRKRQAVEKVAMTGEENQKWRRRRDQEEECIRDGSHDRRRE